MRWGILVLSLLFSIVISGQNSFTIEKVFFVDDRNWKEFVDDNDSQPNYADVDASDTERLNEILNNYRPVQNSRYKMPNDILYGMVVNGSENYDIRLSFSVIGVYDNGIRRYYFIKKAKDREWLREFSAKIRKTFDKADNT